MLQSPSIKAPLAWTSPGFSLEPFNLIFFPGGHEKGVRQVIDSDVVRNHLVEYFPKAKRGSNKAVAAICHGVLVVSESLDKTGKSVIAKCKTTTLPNVFESSIFWATRAFLGDYYKTYGADSENCEDMVCCMINTLAKTNMWLQVRKRLDDPHTQFQGKLSPGPYVQSVFYCHNDH